MSEKKLIDAFIERVDLADIELFNHIKRFVNEHGNEVAPQDFVYSMLRFSITAYAEMGVEKKVTASLIADMVDIAYVNDGSRFKDSKLFIKWIEKYKKHP